jgi:predicted transcriptional regulator
MDKKLEAQRLRQRGYTYVQIGKELNVSHTTAHNYINGYKKKAAFNTCGFKRPGHTEVCTRWCKHRGVHLSSENGVLVYW